MSGFLSAGGGSFTPTPKAPTLTGTVTNANLNASTSVFYYNNYVYVACYLGTNRLTIVDVTDSSAPAVIGSLGGIASAAAVHVDPPYAYVSRNGGLTIVDISNATAPTSTGTLTLSAGNDHYAIFVAGDYCYVGGGDAAGNGYFYIVDISNPAAPRISGSITASANLDHITSITVLGDVAYITSGASGRFNIVNISDKTAPTISGAVSGLTTPTWSVVTGKVAFVTGYSSPSHLYVINISNPAAPALLGTATLTQNSALNCHYNGNYVLVNCQGGGLSWVDVSDLTTPVETLASTVAVNLQGSVLSGRYLYGATSGGLAVISATPAQLLNISTGSLNATKADITGSLSAQNTYLDALEVGKNGIISNGRAALPDIIASTVTGYVGVGATPGGSVTISGGAGSTTTGAPGDVNIYAGVPNGTGNNGGNILLRATNANGSGTIGGNITLTAGNGAQSTGGNITLTAGGATGGPPSGNGGTVALVAGSPDDGNGGPITITAGNGVTATAANRNGGSVTISAGQRAASGTSGNIMLATGNTTTNRWSVTAAGNFEKQTQGNYILSETKVTANTTDPLALAHTDSWTAFTNEGATTLINFSLPSAAAGMQYTFIVQDADGIQVDAAGGDTIRIAGSVSAAAGNIASTTIGSTVTLLAINVTEWIAISSLGSWTVT